MRVSASSANRPKQHPTPLGRDWFSRPGRYLLAVGLHASSLAIALSERLPVREPHPHRCASRHR